MKTKIEQVDEFKIANHYLPALINGDESGLSDNESEQLNEFLYPKYDNCWFEVIDSDSSEFGRDYVSGLMADVSTVSVWKNTAK